MSKKRKSLLKRVGLGLVVGMQKAGEEIVGTTHNGSNDSMTITAQAEATNLAEALLRGEVTQEVEELRWRTYAVDNEAKKLDYEKTMERKTGKRVSKKIDSPVIIQENTQITAGVGETLATMRIKDDWSVKFSYSNTPKFKLENYLRFITVDKRNKTVTLKFGIIDGKLSAMEHMFMVALIRAEECFKGQNAFNRCNLLNTLSGASFITYKCVGVDDFWKIEVGGIVHDVDKCSYRKTDFEVIITMPFTEYKETYTMPEFKAEELQEKYRTKAERESTKTVNFSGNEVRMDTCEVCGCQVDSYESSTIFYETGKVMCRHCYAKSVGLDESLSDAGDGLLLESNCEKIPVND